LKESGLYRSGQNQNVSKTGHGKPPDGEDEWGDVKQGKRTRRMQMQASKRPEGSRLQEGESQRKPKRKKAYSLSAGGTSAARKSWNNNAIGGRGGQYAVCAVKNE